MDGEGRKRSSSSSSGSRSNQQGQRGTIDSGRQSSQQSPYGRTQLASLNLPDIYSRLGIKYSPTTTGARNVKITPKDLKRIKEEKMKVKNEKIEKIQKMKGERNNIISDFNSLQLMLPKKPQGFGSFNLPSELTNSIANIRDNKGSDVIVGATGYYPTSVPFTDPLSNGGGVVLKIAGARAEKKDLKTAGPATGISDEQMKEQEDENEINDAKELFLDEDDELSLESRYFLVQMPSTLPFKIDPNSIAQATANSNNNNNNNNNNDNNNSNNNKTTNEGNNANTTKAAQPHPAHLSQLRYLPNGRLGKMRIHKSGKVELVLSNGLKMDVKSGVPAPVAQEACILDTEKQICISLGLVEKKMIITPNIQSLLEKTHTN